MARQHERVGIGRLCTAVAHHEASPPSYAPKKGSKGSKAASAAAGHGDELNFVLGKTPPSTFNVLYVQTPRVGLLQAPLFRAFAETCEEAADLVKPLLRLGMRETSLFDKCPLYDPEFSRGPHGHMIMLRRTRELTGFVEDGSLFKRPDKVVPKGRVYIHDFPNPFTVLLLNLGAYYLITRQSARLRGG